MPYCYYTCNLLPLDLIVRTGYAPRWLGLDLASPLASGARETVVVHPMTCPCVTKFAAAAENVMQKALAPPKPDSRGHTATPSDTEPRPEGPTSDCLVVPGGCDAMRRLGDLLAAMYPGRVFLLHLPRSSGPHTTRTLANDLRRLEDWLRSRLPEPGAGDPSSQQDSQTDFPADTQTDHSQSCPPVAYPGPRRPGGAFIIAGPLTDNSLLRLVEQCGVPVSALESCTSPDRWRPLSQPGLSLEHEALAALILETGMCPRRSTAERRAHLEKRLLETRASSIIYARQSFCDPGAYDAVLAADLAHKLGLPFLEIEVDFPFDANGPLRTRVEAFLEAQILDDELLDDALFP